MASRSSTRHPGFVSLIEVCEELILDMVYATKGNFTGEVVPGYHRPLALMAMEPALAVVKAQKEALRLGLSLKIWDAYRPVKAVNFFQEWALRPEVNPEIQAKFYPDFTRKQLFEMGYIARRSSHSRGAATDLTLVDLTTGEDLDMGSDFDFFDQLSNTHYPDISPVQRQNRMLLKNLMESYGFENYEKEWWHYAYKKEPYPDEYFDFDII